MTTILLVSLTVIGLDHLMIEKAMSGYIFCLGSNVIVWSSKKQKTVTLSSAEAEYIAATDAVCEAIWLRRLLSDLQQKIEEPTVICCDNMSAIAMTKKDRKSVV